MWERHKFSVAWALCFSSLIQVLVLVLPEVQGSDQELTMPTDKPSRRFGAGDSKVSSYRSCSSCCVQLKSGKSWIKQQEILVCIGHQQLPRDSGDLGQALGGQGRLVEKERRKNDARFHVALFI